jgi:acetyl-CoA acetyltransferase family protein
MPTVHEAFIVDAVRTPVGRGHPEKGVYKDIHPADLLGRTYVGLLQRSGVDPAEVDNVIAGCVYQIGEQSQGITRNAWLSKGLPETTGATTLDIRCGSGQQALHFAALRVSGGIDDVVVAGGVEHMGRVGFSVNEKAQEQWGSGFTHELLERYDLVPQGEGAEMIADQYEITREAMDELALTSHRRAHAATESGAFNREILPIETGAGPVTADQGIRPETTREALGGLRTVFRPEGGRITAGNASQVSDGAAALLVMSGEKAAELGVRPRARIIDQVVLGVDPVTMLTGPIPATEKILRRNGLTIGDLDAIEINEAFASVVLAWAKVHGPDLEKVNPRGGAIALGHPLGSTGARLMTTLLHELEDLDGELGLVTMCCGGGLGTATLIQRV